MIIVEIFRTILITSLIVWFFGYLIYDLYKDKKEKKRIEEYEKYYQDPRNRRSAV